jgi:hypothetical protein
MLFKTFFGDILNRKGRLHPVRNQNQLGLTFAT